MPLTDSITEQDSSSSSTTSRTLHQTVDGFGVKGKQGTSEGDEAFAAFRDAREAIALLRPDLNHEDNFQKLGSLLNEALAGAMQDVRHEIICESRLTQLQALIRAGNEDEARDVLQELPDDIRDDVQSRDPDVSDLT